MKRNSAFGAVLVTAIALSVPTVAWSQTNFNVSGNQDIAEPNSNRFDNQDITDNWMLNHHGGTHAGTHHDERGRHGGCHW